MAKRAALVDTESIFAIINGETDTQNIATIDNLDLDDDPCSVCGGEINDNNVTFCKNGCSDVEYCSAECAQNDWDAGHCDECELLTDRYINASHNNEAGSNTIAAPITDSDLVHLTTPEFDETLQASQFVGHQDGIDMLVEETWNMRGSRAFLKEANNDMNIAAKCYQQAGIGTFNRLKSSDMFDVLEFTTPIAALNDELMTFTVVCNREKHQNHVHIGTTPEESHMLVGGLYSLKAHSKSSTDVAAAKKVANEQAELSARARDALSHANAAGVIAKGKDQEFLNIISDMLGVTFIKAKKMSGSALKRAATTAIQTSGSSITSKLTPTNKLAIIVRPK